jgi:hypothetical protein
MFLVVIGFQRYSRYQFLHVRVYALRNDLHYRECTYFWLPYMADTQSIVVRTIEMVYKVAWLRHIEVLGKRLGVD